MGKLGVPGKRGHLTTVFRGRGGIHRSPSEISSCVAGQNLLWTHSHRCLGMSACTKPHALPFSRHSFMGLGVQRQALGCT